MTTSERTARHALLPVILASAFCATLCGLDLLENHAAGLPVPEQVAAFIQHIGTIAYRVPEWLGWVLILTPIPGATVGVIARRTRAGRAVMVLSLLTIAMVGTDIAASYRSHSSHSESNSCACDD